MTAEIVSPSSIEKRLNEIWGDLSLQRKTRACLFNLIVYQRHSSKEPYIAEVIQRVVEKFPCRILSIVSKCAQQEELITKISLSSSKQNEIICDHIQFFLKEDLSKIPFLLLPHLLPDLPIYLLWADDLSTDTTLFEALQKYTTRVIFDSDVALDLSVFAKTVLSLSKKIPLADLNWARIESWRDLLLTAFNAEKALKDLESAVKIKIEYNKETSLFYRKSAVPALYLCLWLANRLSWKYVKGDKGETGLTLYYTNKEGKPLFVECVGSSHPTLKPGSILSFSVESATCNEFYFTRNQARPHLVFLHVQSKTTCDLPIQFVIEQSQTGRSLAKEIYCQGTSSHYLGMLDMLLQLDPTLYAT